MRQDIPGFRQEKPPDGEGGGAEGKPIRSERLGNSPWLSSDLITPAFPHGGLSDPTGGLQAQKPGLPRTERRLTQF